MYFLDLNYNNRNDNVIVGILFKVNKPQFVDFEIIYIQLNREEGLPVNELLTFGIFLIALLTFIFDRVEKLIKNNNRNS